MNEAKDLTKRVKDYAHQKVGFDLVGIASAFDPQFDRAPKGDHPDEWLPGAKSVITGGIKVLQEILDTTPSPLYAKHYDQMNAWLLQAGYRLARGLQVKVELRVTPLGQPEIFCDHTHIVRLFRDWYHPNETC
jgi:hypothetical protein